jgi:hypothetical protein
MKKQISCPHFEKKSLSNSVYNFKLIDSELNLCIPCYKKLIKQIKKQDTFEQQLKSGDKNGI